MVSDKLKVLIVDDRIEIRKLLSIIVQSAEAEVIGEAEEGKKALKIYKETPPDIVFLDIEMPVMNGMETLKGILKIDSSAHVIMVTTVDNTVVAESCMALGAKGFIHKDQDPMLIKARISELISNLK